MKTNKKYKEIADSLKEVKLSGDDIEIKVDVHGVRIIAGKDNMICSYMMKRIYIEAELFNMDFYVRLTLDDKPEVIIYE